MLFVLNPFPVSTVSLLPLRSGAPQGIPSGRLDDSLELVFWLVPAQPAPFAPETASSLWNQILGLGFVCVLAVITTTTKPSKARFLVLGTGESRLGCPPCSSASVNGALQCDVSLPRSLHGLPATALQVQEHAASFSHTSHFDRSLAGRIKREFLAPLWLFEYSPSVDLGMRGELPFPCPIANNPASALCETPPEHTTGWPI